MTTIVTNPYKAVDFNQKAIEAALERNGSVISEIKYDGVRGELLVKPAEVNVNAWFQSRTDKEIPALSWLTIDWEQSDRWDAFLSDLSCIYPKGMMIDCELMVKGVDFSTSAGLLRTKWRKKTNYAFDRTGLPPLKGSKVPFDLDLNKLEARVFAVLPLDVVESGADGAMNCLMQTHAMVTVQLLTKHFPEVDWKTAESYDVFSMDELNELFTKVRERGLEGLIVKDPTDCYKRGKKTGWWKLKPQEDADGIIQGVNWGTEGLSNEGKVIGFSVLLESGTLVDANNISRELMDEFTANVKEHGEDYYNGWACQIKYMEVTESGSLRHPSFDRFRGTESCPQEKI